MVQCKDDQEKRGEETRELLQMQKEVKLDNDDKRPHFIAALLGFDMVIHF